MKTKNENIQHYLSEGLKAARARGIAKGQQGSYCAAYLAGKLAGQRPQEDCADTGAGEMRGRRAGDADELDWSDWLGVG